MRIIFSLILSVMPFAVSADAVYGLWHSEKNDKGAYIEVTIAACGDKICGKITNAFDGDDPSIIGRDIIWDMVAVGNGKYRGGIIWAPDTDKEYRSKMSLTEEGLRVSGCIGPICRGQDWTRAE